MVLKHEKTGVFILGLFAGLAIGALLVVLHRNRNAPRSVSGNSGQAAPSGPESATVADTDRLKELEQGNKRLLRDVVTLRDLLHASQKDSPNGRVQPHSDPREIRGQLRLLGGKYAELENRRLKGEKIPPAEFELLGEEVARAAEPLVRMYGVSPLQAFYSPVGDPALLLGFLEGFSPGLSEVQMTRGIEILETGRRAWEAEAESWGTLSILERNLKSLQLESEIWNSLLDLASPGQVVASQIFDKYWAIGTCDSVTTRGTREGVPESFAKDWIARLAADEIQAREIRFAAGEYADDYDAAIRELNRQWPTMGQIPWRDKHRAELQVMIDTRKRIASRITMTPAQQEAFDAWAVVYSWRE